MLKPLAMIGLAIASGGCGSSEAPQATTQSGTLSGAPVRPTSAQVRTLAHDVFALLQRYIAVHDDMLGRSTTGYLEAIDFKGNAVRLDEIRNELSACRTRSAKMASVEPAELRLRTYLARMADYLAALSDTVQRLGALASRMAGKAQGKPYPWTDYERDTDAYFASVERYQGAGAILKKAWDEAGL